MIELKTGDTVKIKIGGQAKVKKELGRGGQGIVYLVEYNGMEYALKWYTIDVDDNFYNNLQSNTARKPNSPYFLWPEMLTEKRDGTFGYLMKLRPPQYSDFGDLMLAKTQFSSFSAMLNAALNICSAFQKLHIVGLSYQDLNDGNFFIDTETGDVLICDNDNVVPNGTDAGILGKSGYMAPEIIEGKKKPNVQTDYFSLAVVLFILFYNDRPFVGQRVMNCPCLTEEAEKKLYGQDAVFICDPNDTSNRPVRGLHNNVIKRWPVFPRQLREAFIKTFSKDAIQDPAKRIIDRDWQRILLNLRDSLVNCPYCKKETFLDLDKPETVCLACGKAIQKPSVLKIDNNNVALLPGKKIYKSHTHHGDEYHTVVGQVIANPANPNLYGIQNVSDSTWQAISTKGEMKQIGKTGVIPVMCGIKITFPDRKAEII